MKDAEWQLAFDARSHTIPLVASEPAEAAGWLGGPVAPEWSTPPDCAHVAVVLDLARCFGESGAVVLYVSDIPGICCAKRELVTPAMPGSVTRFSLGGAAIPDRSWTPAVPQLGGMGCKLGGRPGCLQHDLADADALRADGYEFFAQVDCEDGLAASIAPMLCDGGLYLFVRRMGPRAFDFDALELRWQF